MDIGDDTQKIVDISTAFDEENVFEESEEAMKGLKDSTNTGGGKGGNKNKAKIDPKLARRQKQIDKVCRELECSHPLTPQAALTYATHMLELDEEIFDVGGTKKDAYSHGLLDCVVLAAKLLEYEVPDLDELDERDTGMFKNWTVEAYTDTETTVWMMMDFCLLPRRLVHWA